MNCWKCGEPTKHGAAECETCEAGLRFQDIEDGPRIVLIEIDWDKVRTFEDLRDLVKNSGVCDFVIKGSEDEKALKRFLKEPKNRKRESENRESGNQENP